MQKIGILRGGVGPEYEFSIQTGAEIAKAIYEAGLEAVDMFLDKEGVLHIKGVPAKLEDIPLSVDYVWNALHGEGAEDGQIVELLENYGIKYSGSSKVSSLMAMQKDKTKEIAKSLGMKTPQYMLVFPEKNESISSVSRQIYTTISPPWVIKPLSGTGSLNTFIAKTVLDLAQIVEECFSHSEPFIVEQYIYGNEAAVGVIENFRNDELYALPVMEVERGSNGILDFETRKNNPNICKLGNCFTVEEKEKIAQMGKDIHRALGIKDFSQSEFIVDSQDRIWFIETDTHPYFLKNSPFLVALNAVGARLQDFIKAVIENK